MIRRVTLGSTEESPVLVKGSVFEQSEDGLGAFNRVNNQPDYVMQRYSAEYIKDERSANQLRTF